jgi:hypothetical protein
LTSVPRILKICALIPIYGIVSFITIAFPNSYIYLDSWIEVFQAIALGSFFLLLCEFVSPSSQSRDVFFAGLEVPKSRLGGRKNGGRPVDGLEWYRVRTDTMGTAGSYPVPMVTVS